MAKAKTREELQWELEKSKKMLEQALHQAERLDNRIHDLQAKERKERNHRLITRGGTVEHFWPEVRTMSEREFFMLMEMVLTLPAAKSVLHSFRPSGGADG